MTDETAITFGEHKGKLLKKVPASWLIWFYNQSDTSGVRQTVKNDVWELEQQALRKYISDNYEAIQKRLPDEPTRADIQEYKMCIDEFGKAMLHELRENHDKGGRKEWLVSPLKYFVDEVYYYNNKLLQAVLDGDTKLIKQYSADIANLGLMVYDKVEQFKKTY